jgi:hypothetical protein
MRRQIKRGTMSLLILVVDDEPDVEALFRQQFRHDLRARFMAFTVGFDTRDLKKAKGLKRCADTQARAEWLVGGFQSRRDVYGITVGCVVEEAS